MPLSAGTGGPKTKDELCGYGAMFADVDRDGLVDLYTTMILAENEGYFSRSDKINLLSLVSNIFEASQNSRIQYRNGHI